MYYRLWVKDLDKEDCIVLRKDLMQGTEEMFHPLAKPPDTSVTVKMGLQWTKEGRRRK